MTPIYYGPSTLVTFHLGHLPPWSPPTLVTFHLGHLPPWSPSTLVTFHLGHLPPWSPSTLVTFHLGHLPPWSPSTLVTFHLSPHHALPSWPFTITTLNSTFIPSLSTSINNHNQSDRGGLRLQDNR
ncbi:uncharacterized protein N7487_006132 [Penicillium crustosum]|uniref:uncharacterized protein n=1 Tax=Penicillium crustosum TaxID=36656 RepID=UPI002388134A|nr:uncharacterized protein N7487_006132 [Penicillium crustosum]KAJ5411773.1 hypothetical protein N7487_006132 [Penicillium crustosum]